MDEAEDARVAQQSRSLDEDQLGHLETDVRALGQLLRQGDAKVQPRYSMSISLSSYYVSYFYVEFYR